MPLQNPTPPHVFVALSSIDGIKVTISYTVVASPGDLLSRAEVVWNDKGAITENLPPYNGTAVHVYSVDGDYTITVNVYRGSNVAGSSSIQIRV
ncbi:MAG: hypothetical protein ACREA3_00220 [Nitrosotalea sp.]